LLERRPHRRRVAPALEATRHDGQQFRKTAPSIAPARRTRLEARV
jgi:hypothetical protein